MRELEQCPACRRDHRTTYIPERIVYEREGAKITPRIDRYLQEAECPGCGAELVRMHRGEPWLVKADMPDSSTP